MSVPIMRVTAGDLLLLWYVRSRSERCRGTSTRTTTNHISFTQTTG
jgi:hypothetical protein